MQQPGETDAPEKIEGWKAIASHLHRDEATVRRWHRDQGLPVHREAPTSRARVFAYADELDAWMKQRAVAPDPAPTPASSPLRSRRWQWFAAASLAVVLIASAAYVRRHSATAPSVPPPDPLRLLAAATAEGGALRSLPIPFDNSFLKATDDGAHVYLWRGSDPQFLRIDISTGAQTAFEARHIVTDLEFSADFATAFYPVPTGVVAFDLRSGQSREFDLGGPPHDLAAAPDGRDVYAAMGPHGVRHLHVPTGAVRTLTTQISPQFLALDTTGHRLFISYQNGGPGGRDGHDTVESIDLATGKPTTSPPGPPRVGGPISYSPASRQVWAQLADACITPSYDHLGCPSVPSFGFQLFRAADMHFVATQAWPERFDRPAEFTPNGDLAIIPGPVVRIIDAHRLRVLEQLTLRAAFASYASKASRLFFTGGDGDKRLYYVDPPARAPLTPPAPYAQQFSFDGILTDAVEKSQFQPNGEVSFIPGRIGEALRVKSSGKLTMRSPSWRLGNLPPATLALWVRSDADAILASRGDGESSWALRSAAGRIELLISGEIVAGAPAPPGTWHHVALTSGQGRYSLFIDGNETGHGAAANPPQSEYYVIGGPADFDEFAVFPSILDNAAIRQLSDMPGQLRVRASNSVK